MTGQLIDHALAPRGKIYDRKGRLLADVVPRIVVTVQPSVAQSDPSVLDRLASLLGVSRKRLERSVFNQRHKGSLPVPVYIGATVEQGTQIAEMGQSLSGVGVVTMAMRRYVDGSIAPHVTGWVGVPNEAIEAELKAAGETYVPDYVGRDGIERTHDGVLRGRPGTTVYAVDTRRRPIRQLMSEAPTPGVSLVLGLDLEVQRVAREALAGQRGAVVALDPRTGEVICMVSTPGFDVSVFDGGLSDEDVAFLYQNESRPMLKRGIAGVYPPGSTYKIVTAMAAYRAGVFNPREVKYCPGFLTVGNRRVRCENHPAASYSFLMAMTRSCNTYFGRLAQRAGSEALRTTAFELGFGARSGVDVPGEVSGRVPDEDWVRRRHGRPWSIGDTNNVGIGQGDLEVTPLQMAILASLVANEGVAYRPHVVRARIFPGVEERQERVEREVLLRFDASPDFWQLMRASLRSVVAQGTGRRADVVGHPVSGKTGSAENAQSRKTHAWFVGYAPADRPTIAFAVVVETAGHGGVVAAPVAQKIVEAYLVGRRGGSGAQSGESEEGRSPSVSVTLAADDESPEER